MAVHLVTFEIFFLNVRVESYGGSERFVAAEGLFVLDYNVFVRFLLALSAVAIIPY